MVFFSHLIYAVIFIIYSLTALSSIPETREDIRESSSSKQTFIKFIPFGFMLIIYIFPLLDSAVQSNSFESFLFRFIQEFITASFGNMIIFINCSDFVSSKARKLRSVPYIGFIIYTLIKNIVTHGENIFFIILAEAMSLATLVFFYFASEVIREELNPPTRAEKAKSDAETKAYMERMAKKREYEAWKASQYPNSQQNNVSRSSSSSSYSDSSSERKGFFSALSEYAEEYYEKKGETTEDYGRYGKSCSNCTHFDGDTCDCQYSSSYGKTIYSPSSTRCGYHSKY